MSEDGMYTTCSVCGTSCVNVNATSFPDTKFRSYVSTQFDKDNSGFLSEDEYSVVTTINVAGTDTQDGGYRSLEGIAVFTNLEELNCSYNDGLESLDLSEKANLSNLILTGCDGLESLTLTKCAGLTSLDVTSCIGLKSLGAAESGLWNLHLSENNGAIENLNISDTDVNYLPLSYCTNLRSLTINRTPLMSISLSGEFNPYIESISAEGCTSMSTLYMDNCTTLEGLNVSGCSSLVTLYLSSCDESFTSLNVAGCSGMEELRIANTNITDFATTGLDGVPNLKIFDAAYANIEPTDMEWIQTRLPISLQELYLVGNTAITTLSLNNITDLTKLDLSYCTGLTSTGEQKAIDLTGCAPTSALRVIVAGTTLTTDDFTYWNGLWTLTEETS